jgi:hypothetical protein
MPGNVVDTDTISKEDKKRANIIDRTTMNCFLGDSSSDWSAMETNLRSGTPDGGGADSSSAVAGTANEEIEKDEVSLVDEEDDIAEGISVGSLGSMMIVIQSTLQFYYFRQCGTRFAEVVYEVVTAGLLCGVIGDREISFIG